MTQSERKTFALGKQYMDYYICHYSSGSYFWTHYRSRAARSIMMINLFTVDDKVKKLAENSSQLFHHVVAKDFAYAEEHDKT